MRVELEPVLRDTLFKGIPEEELWAAENDPLFLARHALARVIELEKRVKKLEK